MTLRLCTEDDLHTMLAVINDAARAYKGVIPAECYHEPYMPEEELRDAFARKVIFWAYEDNGEILGVMGIQDLQDVTLIRHAYVRATQRNKGIGGGLLQHLLSTARKPVLIGTWRSAVWAIRFYEKYGFTIVPHEPAQALLAKYWEVSRKHAAASVVLAQKEYQLPALTI